MFQRPLFAVAGTFSFTTGDADALTPVHVTSGKFDIRHAHLN